MGQYGIIWFTIIFSGLVLTGGPLYMIKTIKNNMYMLGLIFNSSPSYIFLNVGLVILSSTLSAINILLTRYVINSFAVFKKSISIGDFVALSGSCVQLFGLTSGFFALFTQMHEHSVYIDEYLEFLSLGKQKQKTKISNIFDRIPTININNVSFHYANSEM